MEPTSPIQEPKAQPIAAKEQAPSKVPLPTAPDAAGVELRKMVEGLTIEKMQESQQTGVLKKIGDTITTFFQAGEKIPSQEHAEDFLKAAKDLFLDNQPDAALKILEEMEDKNNSCYLLLKGAILEKQGKLFAALVALEKAELAATNDADRMNCKVSKNLVFTELRNADPAKMDIPNLLAYYAHLEHPDAEIEKRIKLLFRDLPQENMTEEEIQAIAYFIIAAEKNPQNRSSFTCYMIGDLYEEGVPGLKINDKKAFEWYKRGADMEKGNPNAQRKVGQFYELGKGGAPHDEWNARSYYEKAAKQGLSSAQYDFARLLVNHGYAEDYPKAAYWLEQAANQGNGQAAYNLALLYQQGREHLGFPPNPTLANHWFEVAATHGIIGHR